MIMAIASTYIPAIEARKRFGELLDKTFYRGESFIVERAGEPKAAIVPVREYEELQRRKKIARERFWEMTETLRKRTSQYDPKEIQAAIDEAIEAVRHSKSD